MEEANKFLEGLEPEQFHNFFLNPLLQSTSKENWVDDDGTKVEDTEFEYEFTAMIYYFSKEEIAAAKALARGIPGSSNLSG